MKVAIPMFGNRVSPRLDCAPAFLVVTLENDQSIKREEFAATSWAPHERTGYLIDLRVDAVICGGIDWCSAETLQRQGIVLYGGVTGDIEEAVAALVRGELNSPALPPRSRRGRDDPPN
ncbi:MAG: hypothetical protein JJ992_04380 [Planctomycetes bacterium]|jgi:predicted Fe-Mo cluster-binding NifX family protein|nr:hypothetical protein [Planctomycetota bacterium]